MSVLSKIKAYFNVVVEETTVDGVLGTLLEAVKKLETVAEKNVTLSEMAKERAADAAKIAQQYNAEAVRAEKVVENLRKLLEAKV